MLSSLFASRNTTAQASQTKQLFDLTTKKIDKQQPAIKEKYEGKPITKQQEVIQQELPHQDNLQATIFVGNVHLSTKHKQLKAFFQKYGKVQKVWFRSLPVQANKMGRRASHILKKYQEGADSMNAYVQFEDELTAKEACKENGSVFKDLTIRVTLCKQKNNDTQTTVFVGNLSHDIKEQQLRDHFASAGKIVSVRVIRSRQTNKGIGIGYVHFSTKQQMKQAISTLNDTQLLGRKIRVKKAVAPQRLEKKQKKIQQKFGKKYKPKGGKQKYINKNSKAVQFRQKAKQIKLNREANNKTKQIRK